MTPQGETPFRELRRLRVRLQQAREALGLTQRDVAEALDWSTSKLICIENGAVGIRVTDLKALLTHYGITENADVDQLIGMARASKKSAWQSRPVEVFISYAHDPEGMIMARALLAALRERGCDVTSDHDSHLRNPSSVPGWMDDEIASRVVLCVLSSEYLQTFADATKGATSHKGVRYELRLILQRIYDHEGRYGCPVIPVASPEFQMGLAAPTLRALYISRFDPKTGRGTDPLVARIFALESYRGNDAFSVEEQTPPINSHLITVPGRPNARLVPIERRTWHTFDEVADMFRGPADSEWERDRDKIDQQQLLDPWATA